MRDIHALNTYITALGRDALDGTKRLAKTKSIGRRTSEDLETTSTSVTDMHSKPLQISS